MKLTPEVAASLAELPLRNIQREYPNVIVHVLMGPEDVKSPKELHPAFYGCFDWHSSVHGHWMLVRLLKEFDLPQSAEIRRQLSENLTAKNLLTEAAYLRDPNRKSFERMYGWTWLLKLAEELRTWDDPQAREWASKLRPLEEAIVQRYAEFLPKQTYPIRVGTHASTAFGLSFALDYARAAGQKDLENLLLSSSTVYFLEDLDIDVEQEPSGADFLSPSLIEADLMRRVLVQDDFVGWLEGFLPHLEDADNLLTPAVVSDRSDPQIAHLDGLNLSRAWCMKAVADALPQAHPYVPVLLEAAERHAAAGLDHVASGHYEGEHWLGSFAIWMLAQWA